MTSHDVVARVRRALGTRKVGHAGTLDPMATGLLVVGVGSATRLLHYLVGLDKEYSATIRLGAATTTDDAEGEAIDRAPLPQMAALAGDPGATSARIDAAMAGLTGIIAQVPSAVSAIKVQGRRAYERVRSGETVELAPRAVIVSVFERLAIRTGINVIDVDVRVECSSGTYVRALARDLGGTLGVGGHLTALRRTRVGRFDVTEPNVVVDPSVASVDNLLAPAAATARVLPVRACTDDEARELRLGRTLPTCPTDPSDPAPWAAIHNDELVAIIAPRAGRVRVVTGFPPEQPVAGTRGRA